MATDQPPSPATPASARYALLKACPRIWAVAAIHGERDRLVELHDQLFPRLEPRDGLVYLGDIMGHGGQIVETIDELLEFRSRFIARPRTFANDVAFLRGSQEEMWHRLLELQFAPNPGQVLAWMVERGIGATLGAYGFRPEEGYAVCREGPLAITRWTTRLRAALRALPGHSALLTAVRRAAYTVGGELLFVNAGIDASRPLTAQSDSFWWGGTGFHDLAEPFEGFRRIVRGRDRRHPGIRLDAFTASLDGGAGFGGKLVAACFGLDGEMRDQIEA